MSPIIVLERDHPGTGTMNNIGFSLLTAVLFSAGFGGTVYYVNSSGSSPFATQLVACDVQTDPCRAALRAQGERLFGRGDAAGGDAAYRRAALAGDFRAAFHLGWHHEEAYRKAVGKKLEAGSSLPEESQPGVSAMPRGAEFETLLKRYEDVPAGPQRPLAERSLAFLWYARAAASGFSPAMNNLGAMYQFGLMGRRDRMQAMTWYQRAAEAANPVARFNVLVVRKRSGSNDCAEDEILAMMSGLSAQVADVEDEIFERTRYRGGKAPGMIRGLVRAQVAAANIKPDEGNLFDALSIVGAMQGFSFDDNPQDYDDAEEVAAAAHSGRNTCEDGPRRSAHADHQKLERLRGLQDANERARTAQLRKRW